MRRASKTLKTITAGCLVLQALYPRRDRRDGEKQRAAKSKASSAAQKRLNQLRSALKLELLLAANFPRSGDGLVLVLTFDDEHLPNDRKGVQNCVKSFLKRLRAQRKQAGLPAPVMFWAPEILSSSSGRWHVHAVLDNVGADYEHIRRAWIFGSEVQIDKLRVDNEKSHESLARYMTKELRECQEYESRPGLHGWSCTRNIVRPNVETETVDESFRLAPPESATVLLDELHSTEFASWQVLKFRTAAPGEARIRRRSRRRRKC